MKKELLLKLLNLIKTTCSKDDLKYILRTNDTNDISSLLNLDDDEVKDILSTKEEKLMLSKLYIYLHSIYLYSKKIDSNIVSRSLDEISLGNINVYYALQITDKVSDEELLDYFNLIVNAKGEEQAFYAVDTLLYNKSILERKDRIEFIKLITNSSESYKSKYISSILSNYDSTKHRDVLLWKIINSICDSKKDYQAKYICDLFDKGYDMIHPKFLDIIKQFLNTENEYNADYLYKITSNTGLMLEKPNIIMKVSKIITEAKESYHVDSAYELLKESNVLDDLSEANEEQFIETLNIIVNAKSRCHAQCLTSVASKEEYLNNKEMLEIMRFMSTLNEEYKIINASKVVDLHYYIKKDKLKLIKELGNTKSEAQARVVVEAIIDIDLSGHKDAVEIISILANCPEEFQSQSAYRVAINYQLLERDDVLNIVRTIANAKEDYQAELAAEIATEPNMVLEDDLIKYVSLIANSPRKYQAQRALQVIKDEKFIHRKDAYEIINLIVNAKEEYQADAATALAIDEVVLEQEEALKIIKHVVSIDDKKKLEMAKKVIVSTLNKNKKNNSAAELVFSKLKASYQEDISCVNDLMRIDNIDTLIESVSSSCEVEIKPNTKVKVKAKNMLEAK